ncbi:alpha-L-arabinofuranosidase C-terminal domain-containing protein [Microbacter margulisiae]|uniref:non-reducing end alpha-L-arabinofuranosidase n=1 Tax=Microbacter margulisiae TaxID=1350067 RepID=A0A7W5DSS7_9PORP|nr:alpha-L-arabinofuranosidase C-terminal domain-containing protein [Microbacter margulisiae]MBB3188100.1 alpha-L-arabinofuranosidase [Microbacter margulisiae]
MNKHIKRLIKLSLLLLLFATVLQAKTVKRGETRITVEVNKPGHKISPMLFGIFFEDINLSTDGGMYPELVRNRSFEDADTLQYWKFISADGQSKASIASADAQVRPPILPLNPYNRKSLCIKANGAFNLVNDGYWGMNIIQGDCYTFQLAARTTDDFRAPLTIRIVSSTGKELASGEIKAFGTQWQYHSLDLSASGSDPKAHLEISGTGKGTLYLDMVSLMPDKTWKNHGLRIDLADALDSLHPRFMRFPGGSFVEGVNIADMYNWKNTIGNIDMRTPLRNLWGYNSTNGIGFQEYLQLAEDLGAEPLFCINAGMSYGEVVPMDRMGQWEQDALDAIQYANGPVTSVWGSLRAKNGHPEPFHLKYIEIGNENGGTTYDKRWELIANAIHAKYPNIKLIADEWEGGHPHDPMPAIIDEHYYNNPDWFIWNAHKYDSYDRKGPKVFIGEYAVTSGTGKGDLRGAIGEAAWMTGMERNSDIVEMGSYAPLFCNANHRAWPINLINFDSYRWYGIPSYYVQEMFSNNQGTVELPVSIEHAPVFEIPVSSGCIGLGTRNSSAEFKDLQVVSSKGKILFNPKFSQIDDQWRKSPRSEWTAQNGVLKNSSNTFWGSAIFMGDTAWTNYTITLKARKISGEHGFQIYFRNKSRNNHSGWDIGESGDTTCSMTYGLLSDTKKINIESGRWYDIKVVIRGNSIKGYLDGKLIQELSDADVNVKDMNASASYDDKSGDIILKIVNSSAKPVKTEIDLTGAANLTGNGKAIVLTSASPLDENTLEDPTKVSPKTEMINFSGNTLTRLFPGNSLTVLRLTTKK